MADEDEVLVLSWADAANFTYAITAAVMAGESLPKFPPALLPKSAVHAGLNLFNQHLMQSLDYVAARFTNDLEMQERFRREVDTMIMDLNLRIEHIFEGKTQP